jgi:hypothetical protein
MRRLAAAVGVVTLAAGCGSSGGRPRAAPPTAPTPKTGRQVARAAPSRRHALPLGLPPVAPGPVPGYVLIADRNNNRLLLVSPGKRIVWRFPRPGDVRPGQSFYNPDDAFFTPGLRRVVTNEEFNDTVAQIDLRSHRIVWSYGSAGVAGSGRGELSNPDDAYVLPNGDVTIADIRNCRVLRLSPAKKIVSSIGRAGSCAHDPPRSLESPNGATPLPHGGTLVTEIGGWVDRIDAGGRLVYSVRTPTTYPSDAQLLPNGNLLVAGFNTPGRVDELTPEGKVVWTYGPATGPGSLDRPSLAVRWPNGMIAVTDDWHHRIVVIDPRTKQIVWQYGHDGVASAADGYLSKPDGLDLLPSRQAAPAAVRPLTAARIGSLPLAASRLSAVALPGGRLVALGGLTQAGSSDQVLLGPPSALRVAGRLPAAVHDSAAALLGSAVYLFGGGLTVSSPAVVRIDPLRGTARRSGTLGEPLSDLGAAVAGGRVYLVGGYTGARYATAILRFRPGAAPTVAARLPAGLRYAGVAALGGRVYVAGGVTTTGESDAVLVFDPSAGTVTRIATLPAPVAHAPLAVLGSKLYLIGGRTEGGVALVRILQIDPATGAVSPAGRLPTPLADAAVVALGGRIVVLGGAGSAPSDAVLELSP